MDDLARGATLAAVVLRLDQHVQPVRAPPSDPDPVARDARAHADLVPVVEHGREALRDVPTREAGAERLRIDVAREPDHDVDVGMGGRAGTARRGEDLEQLRGVRASLRVGRTEQKQERCTDGGKGGRTHVLGDHTQGPPG